MTEIARRTMAICADCGLGYASVLLACPSCRRLLHRDELTSLVAEGEAAENANDASRAMGAYRRALELLPPGAPQIATLNARLDALAQRVRIVPQAGAPATAAPAEDTKVPKWLAPLGVVGVALMKMKGLLFFLLTKAKLLLLGLTKLKTFLSMGLMFGVYAAAWGWPYALGLVLSIYVHEMGHVFAFRRYGIETSAPMFIPGFGAFVRGMSAERSAHESADIGLAGPHFGFAAALVAYLLFRTTDLPVLAAIARSGAAINVFNLIPIWGLDGSRAFGALTRLERGVICAAAFAVAIVTHAPEAGIVGLVGAFRCFQSDAPTERDPAIFGQFLFLLAGLGFVVMLTTRHLPPIH